MHGKKLLPKNLFLLKKISSIAMAAVMIANMFFGYIPTSGAARDVSAAEITPQYRNVMYYGEWSIYSGQKNYTPDKIPGNYITHLNFAFLDVDESGNVISCDTWADFENPNVGYSAGFDSPWAGVAPAMIQLRNQYPNMKIGFSVGGWTRSGDFPKVAASETARKNFAQNIAKAAHLYGYDFVDIDWEYPTADRDPDPSGNGVTVDKGCKGSAADKKNFTLLLQELRNALDSYGKQDNKHYELSVAMSASPAMMKQIEYDKVLDIVDFANMMTYDLNGAWNAYTGHQTALYTNETYNHEKQTDGQFSVDACIRYLYDTYGNSIDASKIVIGVAPYTRGWAGVRNDGPDSSNPGLYATAEPNSVKAADGTTSGTYAFGDIDTLISQYGLKEYYDETAQAAYYYNEDTGYFFTCDNEKSVTAKAQYVKNEQFKNPFNQPLGGLISWMASLDAAATITKTSYEALFGSKTTLQAQKIEIPAMENVSASVETSGNDYVITIRNNNTVSTPKNQGTLHGGAEANVLYYAEKFAGTATYPVFYIKTTDGAVLSGSAWSAGGTIGKNGDYTTVTYSSWPYYLGTKESQNSEIKLTLTSSTTPDVAKIAEIGMTRRVKDGGREFGWTNLLGNSTGPDISQKETATSLPEQDSTDTTKEQQEESLPDTTKEQTTETTLEPTTEEPTTFDVETTKLEENSKSAGQYPVWSPDNVHYQLGDLVYYEGSIYECTYEHNSNVAWTPQAAFTLWKERTDLEGTPETTKAAEENTKEIGSGEDDTKESGGDSDNHYTGNGTLPQHTVTGYWHNFSNGSANLKLSDVPEYYDLICVAFTGNTATPGEATFSVSDDLKKSIGYSDKEFIEDIQTLKEKGQHVIISVGGAEGRIEINSAAAAEKFAQSMTAIIEKYGFEGVDIDLEGAAVSGTNYIAEALRTMHEPFGDDFIITMAPETAYMTPGGAGFSSYYWNLAMSVKDILTTVHTQFYNSGIMNGYNNSLARPGNGSFPANLSTLYIESGLRPDQVAIGVPSSGPAAGSGQITPQQAASAFNAMIHGTEVDGFTPPKAYPTFRGLMTWSINWDAAQDYAWAKAARAAVDGAPVQETTKRPQESTTGEVQQKNPIKPLGVVAESRNNHEITVTWSENDEMRSLGQTYHIYVDGILQQSNVLCGTYTITPVSAGSHTVTVTGILGARESEGVSVTVIVQENEENSSVKSEASTKENSSQSTKNQTSLIGYYHTWDNAGNPFIKLKDVDENWDVINIAFAEPKTPGSTDGKMKFDISGLRADYTKQDFINDIRTLQAKGKKVVLSIGGYEGYFSLTDEKAVSQFVSDIRSFIDEYGFDGIDIDLEQSSVQFDNQGNDQDINNPTSPKIVNMIQAIRTICESYGDDFILSWAPETFYVQLGYTYYAGINQWCDSRAGDYLPMIQALRDITSYVHVQLYNSMPITAPDGVSYNMGTKEGIVAMCKMLLDGFYVGQGVGVAPSEKTYFKPLRPDQVVIGVPSSQGAAGSGQISNAALQAAFEELNLQYPGIRGIMAWSINWDSSQNQNSFAKENRAFLDRYQHEETTSPKEQSTTGKSEETTQPKEETTTHVKEETTTQPQEETTDSVQKQEIVTSDDITVDGFQISCTVEGMRTVYSRTAEVNGKTVTGQGLVYSLGKYAGEEDLYVGSTNAYVHAFEGTQQGMLAHNYSEMKNAVSYAMTMKFSNKTMSEYTAEWIVRAYVKLEDGSYVYSEPAAYTIYDIAGKLYQGAKMNNMEGHNYLYQDILKVVNPAYQEVDFNWAGSIVK